MALGEQVLKVLIKTAHDGKGFDDANSRLERFGKRVGITGAGLANFGAAAIKATALVSALAVGVGVKAVHSFSQFQDSMQKIVGLVGIAQDEVDAFGNAVLKLGVQTAKGPQELADALFTVTSAGLRGSEAMDVLTAAAKASTAGLGETRSIAEAVTGAINAYGSDVLKAADATDILVATARAGNFETSELAGSLGRVTPFAKAANASFQDVGGAIALLTRVNNDANESVTQTAALFRALSAPTKKTIDALDALGLTTQDVRDSMGEKGLVPTLQMLEDGLIEMHGPEKARDELRNIIPDSQGLSAAFSILNADAETLNSTFDDVYNSTGLTDEAFDAMSKTVSFQAKQAFAFMQGQLIRLGKFLNEELGPEVIAIKEKVRAWVEDNGPRIDALKILVQEMWHEGFKPLVKTLVDMTPVMLETAATISEVLIPTLQTLFNWTQYVLHAVRDLMQAFNDLWSSFKDRGLGGVASKIGGGIAALKELATGEFGNIPQFAVGGTVPGPMGSPQLIVAHGGERITPVRDSGPMEQNITFNVTVRDNADLQSLLRKVEEHLGNKSLSREYGVS